jgi:para-aminobenzoate synthetase component 1
MLAPVCLIPWEAPAPETAFARLQGRRGVFWLDSSLRSEAGRFSILGCEPFGVFRTRGAASEFWRPDGRTEARPGDPRAELERQLALYQVERDVGRPVPFCGGAVGFLGYDFARNADNYFAAGAAAPDAHVAWHDAAAVWDHRTGRAWLVGAGWNRPAAAAAEELGAWLGAAGAPPADGPVAPVGLSGDFTAARYAAAVESVRERIAAGEIYQMNLAQRFTAPFSGSPAALYRRLRALNPAPMGAFVDAGDAAVLCSSPERFFSVAAGLIRTCPIKGTRPRGATPAEDRANAAALLASAKERAELLMIVDLLRSDLGRVCRFGTVAVRRLHALETFATVHHLVGEVEGELRPDVGMAEILAAMFPGGSITGAPKVRAMQVIAETEPVPRGVFSGALGYWSADGRTDLAIAIRTIVCRGEQASFHVGAGIVWDSQPIMEYEETLAKGEALRAALGGRDWPR